MNDILRHLIGAGFRFTMVQFQTLNSVYKKMVATLCRNAISVAGTQSTQPPVKP